MIERLTAYRAAEISESFSQIDNILANIKKAAFTGERETVIRGVLSQKDEDCLKELGYEIQKATSYNIVKW